MATLEPSADPGQVQPEDGVRRRDFINVAALSFAGVGAAAAVLPLVNQMNPSADVLALASTEVDISKIAPERSRLRAQAAGVCAHLSRPKSSRHASSRIIARPQSRAERTRRARPNWLITLGVCTHLAECAGHRRGREPRRIWRLFLPCHAPLRHRARIRKGPAQPGGTEISSVRHRVQWVRGTKRKEPLLGKK